MSQAAAGSLEDVVVFISDRNPEQWIAMYMFLVQHGLDDTLQSDNGQSVNARNPSRDIALIWL